MACLNSDGSLTVVAGAILDALTKAGEPEAIAAATGLPLYRVRAGLRELAQAGVVEATGAGYEITAQGRALVRSGA